VHDESGAGGRFLFLWRCSPRLPTAPALRPAGALS
jgi:hypothetical protein